MAGLFYIFTAPVNFHKIKSDVNHLLNGLFYSQQFERLKESVLLSRVNARNCSIKFLVGTNGR